MVQTIKVTPQGVLVPRPLLISAWGNVEEVEIEQRPDAIIIKPKGQLRQQIIDEMLAAGLIEHLPWVQPTAISAVEREHLTKVLSQGQPLSEIILQDRNG